METLSKEWLRAILDVGRVDTGDQTLFGNISKKSPQTRKLTIVIGIGGIGISTLREAVRAANNNLTPDYSDYARFIAIDTFWGELKYAQKEGVDTIQLPYINGPEFTHEMWEEQRKDFFADFVSREAEFDLFDTSPKMARLTKKVRFYAKVGGKSSDEILREKITYILCHEWSQYISRPVEIMIVAGLSGGTGSGLFIDVAAQVRKACEYRNNVRIFGFLVLPDAFDGFFSNEDGRSVSYRNAFAALKELESYMSIDFETDRKELFPSPIHSDSFEISGGDSLIDYPYLISGSYDNAVLTIANTIVDNMMDNGGRFDLTTHHANFSALRDCALMKKAMTENGVLKADACPEDSHRYCGIGYGYASIPKKIVIPYVVSRINRKMYEPINVETVEKKAQVF